jgi:hypothetical protein
LATKVSSELEEGAKRSLKEAAETVGDGADTVAGLADAVVEVAEESLAEEKPPAKSARRKPKYFKGV